MKVTDLYRTGENIGDTYTLHDVEGNETDHEIETIHSDSFDRDFPHIPAYFTGWFAFLEGDRHTFTGPYEYEWQALAAAHEVWEIPAALANH